MPMARASIFFGLVTAIMAGRSVFINEKNKPY
jgi:hypothetical protein